MGRKTTSTRAAAPNLPTPSVPPQARPPRRKRLVLRPDLKCLFMSGYTAEVIATRGILDEGLRFIQKPFTTSELTGGVKGALGNS